MARGKNGHINDQVYSFFHLISELNKIVSIDFDFNCYHHFKPKRQIKKLKTDAIDPGNAS